MGDLSGFYGSRKYLKQQALSQTSRRRAQLIVKRALDLLLASIALIALAPVMLAIIVAIKIDDGGCILFRQTRIGLHGRPFTILKFRTMTVLEDRGPIKQAQRDDPRVTFVGRFLRKTSLDELPQLLNVLRGQMSLVGPRPHAQVHDEFYRTIVANYELRQLVKPGITGWAQVRGLRGEIHTMDLLHRRIEHDIWYASRWTNALDLGILASTPWAIICQHNAY